MTFKYFAYGSNLLTKRLQGRCPSARFITLANLSGYGFCFHKKSNDKSGKATIFKSEKSTVIGAIFEINNKDKDNLDTAEGLRYGYEEETVCVSTDKGTFYAKTYYAPTLDKTLTPYDWYLAFVIAGRMETKIDHSDLNMQAYSQDTNTDRSTQKIAIKALICSGYTDWKNLLPKLT